MGVSPAELGAYELLVNNHAVQVASIQTLTRRDKPEADLIIIDETHLACSASFKQILNHYSDTTVIGLTATPTRLDGKGLGEIYSDIIQVVPMAKLIAEGHLVKPRVFAPFTPDMKNVRKSKGDYDAIQKHGFTKSSRKERCGKTSSSKRYDNFNKEGVKIFV